MISSDKVFERSAYAQSLRAPLDVELAKLDQEIAEIINLLKIEETRLADNRSTMAPRDFAVAAADFDRRVQRHRDVQDAKVRELNAASRGIRAEFFAKINGVIGAILTERQAAMILEETQVVYVHPSANITQLVIDRVDTAFLTHETAPEN